MSKQSVILWQELWVLIVEDAKPEFPALCCAPSLSLTLLLRKAEHSPAWLVKPSAPEAIWAVQGYPWEMNPKDEGNFGDGRVLSQLGHPEVRHWCVTEQR